MKLLKANVWSASSLIRYQTGWNHWLRFLNQYSCIHLEYKANEDILVSYVAWRFASTVNNARPVQGTSVDKEITAIINGNKLSGNAMDRRCMVYLRTVMAGFKKIRDHPAVRKPIDDSILKLFLNHINVEKYDDLVLFCALVFKKMAVLRSSEDSPNNVHEFGAVPSMFEWVFVGKKLSGLIYKFRKSKTNQFRKELRVEIPCVCDKDKTCAVHWLRYLISVRKFRSNNDSVFKLSSGRIIDGVYLLRMIRKLAQKCNLDPKAFVVHSLRYGGASDYLAWGVPHWLVQEQGNWKCIDSMKPYKKLSSVNMLSLMNKCII